MGPATRRRLWFCFFLYLAAARRGGATRPPASFRLFGAELPTRTGTPGASATHLPATAASPPLRPALPGGTVSGPSTGVRLFGVDIVPQQAHQPGSHSVVGTGSSRGSLPLGDDAGPGSALSSGHSSWMATTSGSPSQNSISHEGPPPPPGPNVASSSSFPTVRPQRGVLATKLPPDDELFAKLQQWGVSVHPRGKILFDKREGAPKNIGDLTKALMGAESRASWSRSMALRSIVQESLARRMPDGGPLLATIQERRQHQLERQSRANALSRDVEERRLRRKESVAKYKRKNAVSIREYNRKWSARKRQKSLQNAGPDDGGPQRTSTMRQER